MSWVLGLTGGIGSGKSTVANLFVARGADLVDTDAIAHELTGAEGAAMPALAAEFGGEILAVDGSLNRPVLREKVFSDPLAKARLEGILHPMIRQLSTQRCQQSQAPYVVLAVPLLVESGNWRQRCQRIVVVDCDEAVQIRRVQSRSGLPEAQIRQIMASQATRAQRLAVADDVIDNNGGLAELQPQVDRLHQVYMALGRGD